MKKLFKKAVSAIRNAAWWGCRVVVCAVVRLTAPVRPALTNNAGEGYVGTAIFS